MNPATRLALVSALTALAAPALAQERCDASKLPADRDPIPTCATCAIAPADAAIHALERATDADTFPIQNRRLAAIATKRIDEALAKGFDAAKSVKVGDYGIVGAQTGLAAILPAQQSALQKKADAEGAIWLRHDVQGSVGANLTKNIPVGPDGLFVQTGLASGATVRVTVDRRYDPRLADIALHAPLNTLTIPFAAADAAAMQPGERVVIDGNGNVAISSEIGAGSIGARLLPGVQLGWSVSAGAVDVLSGSFQTEVDRAEDGIARVTLRTGVSNDVAATTSATVGARFTGDALQIPVATGIDVIDAQVKHGRSAIAGELQHVLSASVQTRNGKLDAAGDLQQYTFDLNRVQARAAYQAALVGDFRPAAELAACGGAGVTFVQEANDRIAKAYSQSKMSLSVLDWSESSASTDETRTIRDATGTRRFDLFGWTWAEKGFLGSKRDVGVEAVHAEIGDDSKSVSLTYRGDLENQHFTSKDEMLDLVSLGRSMMGEKDGDSVQSLARIAEQGRSGLVLPSFINYYGHTSMALDVAISKDGVAAIGAASPETMWAAFADTYHQPPMWATPEGRARLDAYAQELGGNRSGDPDASRHIAEQYWLPSYQRVKSSIAQLQQVGAATDDVTRARRLRDAAEAMGDDFSAGAALAALAGQPARAVTYGLRNQKIDFRWTDVGADSAVAQVR